MFRMDLHNSKKEKKIKTFFLTKRSYLKLKIKLFVFICIKVFVNKNFPELHR